MRQHCVAPPVARKPPFEPCGFGPPPHRYEDLPRIVELFLNLMVGLLFCLLRARSEHECTAQSNYFFAPKSCFFTRG